MKLLFENEYLKVKIRITVSEKVIFCFTGVGHGMNGVDVQKDEFYKLSNNATVVFISDKKRSWGNNIDFQHLKSLLTPFINQKELFAIGNSLGGFLAIVASKIFTFTSVLSFVPQYSVSKKIIPTEERWDKYVCQIVDWRIESLSGYFENNTQYYIFGGYFGRDKLHLNLFPEQDNVHKIFIKNKSWEHQVAKKLKEHNVLYECISLAISVSPPSRLRNIIKLSSDEDIDFV
jgi:hypothetical protein